MKKITEKPVHNPLRLIRHAGADPVAPWKYGSLHQTKMTGDNDGYAIAAGMMDCTPNDKAHFSEVSDSKRRIK